MADHDDPHSNRIASEHSTTDTSPDLLATRDVPNAEEVEGDSFALLDFALTPASAQTVAQAFAASHSPRQPDGVEHGTKGVSTRAGARREQTRSASSAPHLGARLWARLHGAKAQTTPQERGDLGVQPDDLIPDGPLARITLDAPIGILSDGLYTEDAKSRVSPGTAKRRIVPHMPRTLSSTGPLRISAPLGPGNYTLIERRLPRADPDDAWAALSAALGPTELFCFRYSGLTHPGADFRFRVLTGGRATRDVRARSPEGTSVEAPWQGHDNGMPHPFEAESLPPPGAAPMTLMNAGRLASILAAMGLTPEDMFYDVAARRDMLVLSDAPGGTPLATVLARTGAGPLRLHPTAMPAPDVIGASPETGITSSAASQPHGDTSHTDTAHCATSHSGPADPGATLTRAPADPSATTDLPGSSGSWEDEVTAILVAAVEAGLPEDEQVPWLDQLTWQLNSGDIDGALTRAAELIRHGDRPAEQRIAAAARLAALFEARNDGAPLL
ncbi:MAG: hypothetical protein ABNH26_14745 [Celeribacter sp.]|jgi:hypothetical protein